MDDTPTYDDFQRQQSEIEFEQRSTQLVSNKHDLTLLTTYNKDSTNVQSKVNKLETLYSAIRTVRGDGNCFYRAVLFSLIERMIEQGDSKKASEITATVEQSLKNLVSLGYPEYTLEDFHESVLEFFKWVQTSLVGQHTTQPQDRSVLVEEMKSRFTDDDMSQCLICYVRFMISCLLQQNKDEYEPFVYATNYLSIEEYCRNEVEVMGKECDNLSMFATAKLFDLCLYIEYLDVSLDQHSIKIPDDPAFTPQVYLLYRPGHYDILYKNE